MIATFEKADDKEKLYFDYWQFTALMETFEIDTKHASEQLYNKKFGKLSYHLCFLCKNCICRNIRNKMIKSDVNKEKYKLVKELSLNYKQILETVEIEHNQTAD